MKQLLQLFTAFLFVTQLSAQTGIEVPEMTICDTQIQNFMTTFDITGMTFALAKDGELKYMRGFGTANLSETEATNPYHMFRIGSISKPITSIGIMNMIENGELDLEDQVFGVEGILENHWYFENSTIIDPRIYDITVQNLLEHAAGWNRDVNCFPNPTSPYTFFLSGCDPIIAPLHITETQGEVNPVKEEFLVNFLLEKNLNFTPNTSFAYSNIGFIVLSEIIEEISGLSYEEYMQQEILHPLGIYDMHIGKNLLEDKREREGEYIGNYGPFLDLYGSGNYVPWEYGGISLEAVSGAGGWIATSRDLVRLLVAVDGFSTKPDILSSQTISTMTTPSTNNNYYAKGWAVNPSNNWWHNGGLPGTASFFVRSNSGYTWAIIMNNDGAHNPNPNAFWSEVDDLGWNCLNNVSTFPTHDLMDSPTINASMLTTEITNDTTLDLNWTNGNGTSRIVVAKEISNVTGNYNFSSYPMDGSDYTANSEFGAGDNLGDDTFVIYNGPDTAVSLDGLDPNGEYAIRVYEYSKNTNNGDNALYLLGNAAEATSVLGVDDIDLSKQIDVYPTLTSDFMNIDLISGLQNVNYALFDISGRELAKGKLNKPNTKYDVSGLSQGLYLFYFESNGKKQVVKFIKK